MNLPFATNDMFDVAENPGLSDYDSATLAQLIIVLIVILIVALMFVKPNFRKILKRDSMSNSNEIT